MIIVAILLLACTLFFSMICFLLIAQPQRVLGLIVYFANMQEEWHEGKIDLEQEKRLYASARKIEKIVLLSLFGWSCFCGGVWALIEILI